MGTATAKRRRVRLDVPPGQLVNLQGLDRIRGYGDDMQIPQMRGDIALDAERPSVLSAEGGGSPARITTASPSAPESSQSGGPSKLLTGVGQGISQVLVCPLYLQGALLNGLPSPTEEMGVVLGSRRYFFHAAVRRGERGQWAPQRGAPPKHQWYAIDERGEAQPPDIVKQVFDPLLKAVELYYRARYRDFVLAELAWYNNGILDWLEVAARVTKGTATPEEKASFYKVRFSGQMKTMREAEAKILAWLDANPES